MGKADALLKSAGGAMRVSASRREAPAAMPSLGQGGTLGGEKMAGVTRIKGHEIPVDKIIADEGQPREEFDDDALVRLGESIRSTSGVIQPISVRWDEGRSKYVIISGERRWRASKIAGLPTISAVVIDRELTPNELLRLQIIENLQREDLKPMEQAKSFRQLIEMNGWSGNQLAKELGISQSSVSQALSLLELPETVQESVEVGELAPKTAVVIARLADPTEQQSVAAQVVAGKLSRAETIEVVAQRQTKKPKKAKAKVVQQGQSGAGESAAIPAIPAPVSLVSGQPADVPPTLVFDHADCTITIQWKRVPECPVTTIGGDLGRWLKIQKVPTVKMARVDPGQGGEAGNGAEATQGRDAESADAA